MKLISYCQLKSNKGTKILVYKWDRWSRNVAEGLGAKAMLAKNGVEVISVTEPTEDNAIGKAMTGIMLVLAELDNNIKSERTTDGMKAAFDRGHWPWKAPIGYRQAVTNGHKNLILIDAYLPILTTLFEQAGTGLYLRKELADKINRLGFPMIYGKEANDKIIDRILKNRIYYGLMTAPKWKEEKVGNHQPIITEEQWNRAQQGVYKLSPPKENTNTGYMYPLRLFLRCDNCNHPLTASISKGKGGKYGYYHCAKKGCTLPSRIALEKAHEAFDEYLTYFQLSPTRMSLLEALLVEKLKDKVKQQQVVLDSITNHLKYLEKEKLSVVKSYNEELLTKEETKAQLDLIRAQEAGYKIELADNRIDTEHERAVIAFTKSFLADITLMYENLELARKRRLQSLMFPEGVYISNGKIGTHKIAPSFELIKEFGEGKNHLVSVFEKIRTEFNV